MFKKSLFIILVALLSVSITNAQPILSAKIDSSEYSLADLIKVRITLENNPGIHNIFFYLEYDGSVVQFEDLRRGSVVYNTGDNGDLLYADNADSPGFSQSKIVVSYALKGAGLSTQDNGVILEATFRVINNPSGTFSFAFNSGAILGPDQVQITGTWKNSNSFSIVSPLSGEYILIKRPYTNEVVYTDQALVSLICSEGDYLVKLANTTTGTSTDFIPVLSGKLQDVPVSLNAETNRLLAELYLPDPLGGTNHQFLTSHVIPVYKALETQVIKIVSPKHHALVNTDVVNVEVDSTLPYVQVNGGAALKEDELYRKRIHLKNGFNTITAAGTYDTNILYHNSSFYYLGSEWFDDPSASWQPNEFKGKWLEIKGKFAKITGNSATQLYLTSGNEIGALGNNPQPYNIRSTRALDNLTFKDSVEIFYQKDSTLFQFTAPEENQGFKPGEYSSLMVRGEIDSLYKPLENPFDPSYEKNEVTLVITHFPYNKLLAPTVFNRTTVVREADTSYVSWGSRYIFEMEEPISLQGLSDGEIEIKAYKNKQVDTWDDLITRYVYVDNQRLWINLVQPNVYTSDLLDSKAKLEKFNRVSPLNVTGGNILVTESGDIKLSTETPVVEKQSKGNIQAMEEGPDGTLYALVNSSTSLLEIYKKELKDTGWTKILSQSGMYGYDLCYSKIGLLVGVSNIPSNGNSGVYLLSGGKLINIAFPGNQANHAQFIESRNDSIYIYGSLYSYLIAFSTDDLEEANGKLEAAAVTTTPFANTSNIKQFILTEDAGTALLRTDDPQGNIRWYLRKTNGFQEQYLPGLNGNPVLTGRNIIYGSYSDSDYDTFAVPTGDASVEVLMLNRESRTMFRKQLDMALAFTDRPFDSILGIGFHDNAFQFIFKYDEDPGVGEQFTYFIDKGKLFFNKYFQNSDSIIEDYNLSGAGEIQKSQEACFISSFGSIYLGIDSKDYSPAGDTECYNFFRKYADQGSAWFDYLNEDIEEISGFDFSVDPRWLLQPGLIQFGFNLMEKASDPVPVYTPPVEPEDITPSSDIQVNTFTTGEQQNPEIAFLTSGRYIVVWQSENQDGDGYGIYGQLFDEDSSPLGGEFLINTTASGDQINPAVQALPDGFVVVWQSPGIDGSSTGIAGQLFGLSAQKVGAEFLINTETINSQSEPVIAATDSGFFVGWNSLEQDGSAWGAYLQQFDFQGTKIGGETLINTTTNDNQTLYSLAANDNVLFASWHSLGQDGSNLGVYGQIFDLSGIKIGSEFKINTYTLDEQQVPSVCVVDNGFVVAWMSNLQDGSGMGIFAQKFDASGAVSGSEFQVNTWTVNSQSLPRLCSIDTGFAVVWTSEAQDGSGLGVYGQLFDTAGSKAGSEFRIPVGTSNDQTHPVIASASGKILVAWQSDGQDSSGSGIFLRRFVPMDAAVTITDEYGSTLVPDLPITADYVTVSAAGLSQTQPWTSGLDTSSFEYSLDNRATWQPGATAIINTIGETTVIFRASYLESGYSFETSVTVTIQAHHITQTDCSLPVQDLYTLLEEMKDGSFKNDAFGITSYFEEGKQIFHVELTEPALVNSQKKSFFRFFTNLSGYGQESPTLGGFEVYKKIKAKIAGAGSETVKLPIQGFIYDRTVKEVLIYNGPILKARVPVGQNGYFSCVMDLDQTSGSQASISLSCTNAMGNTAALSFTVEILSVVTDIWNVEYNLTEGYKPLEPQGNSFFISADTRDIQVRGSYYGLAGAAVGYELYSTQQEAGAPPIKQGLFSTTTVEDARSFTGIENLTAEYEAGTFSGTVRLEPNGQRLVIFVENPGGYRHEYSVNDLYPVFTYTMPQDQQKIIFDAEYTAAGMTPDNISIINKVKFQARENEDAPYVFSASGTISGEIQALEQFDELLVKSYSNNLIFSNNEKEIVITVDPGNKFTIPFTAVMGTEISQDYMVSVIPTIPVYNYLKKAVLVSVKKDFGSTDFKPDFSPSAPETWSDDQKNTLKNIPILFSFPDRTDVPAADGNMKAKLVLNFGDDIEGTVAVNDSSTYCLKDENGALIYFNGINRGKNRLQWTFFFVDPENDNPVVMSSSYSGIPGMMDYIFYFDDQEPIAPTTVTFDPPLADIYYDNMDDPDTTPNVPKLTVAKDQATSITLRLNGQAIAENTDINQYTFPESALRQGLNTVTILTKDKYGTPDTYTYTFLYDSEDPAVSIASVQPSQDYTLITRITANVSEANFKRGRLVYGSDIINKEPVVKITGEAAYLLTWDNLESYSLDPALKTVTVMATDRADHTAGATAGSFADITRPTEVTVKEQKIELPVYQGVPMVENEVNYDTQNAAGNYTRPFPEHTKFAPAKLLDRVSVKAEIEGNDGVLASNPDMQKIIDPEGQANDFFGESVAIDDKTVAIVSFTGKAYVFRQKKFLNGNILSFEARLISNYEDIGIGPKIDVSGDYAVISRSKGQGSSREYGILEIYKRTQDENSVSWNLIQEQIIEDGITLGFGASLAISDNYIAVGDFGQNEGRGVVYVFEKTENNGNESWNLVQKLTGDTPDINDCMGQSVDVNGDYIITGAAGSYLGVDPTKVYIFKRTNENSENPWSCLQRITYIPSSGFGHAVAINNNYAVIGAPSDKSGGIKSGTAFIYKKEIINTVEVWTEIAKLEPPIPTSGQSFGYSVAMDQESVVVGSPNYGSSVGGSIYYFEKLTNDSWNLKKEILQIVGNLYDYFGRDVDISGNNLVSGAYATDDLGPNSGSAYIIYDKDLFGIDLFGIDLFLDTYNKKHLVFQIPKAIAECTSKADLLDKIKFQVYGLRQDPPDNFDVETVPASGPITLSLDTDAYGYVEGLDNLYYIVDLQKLKDAFETTCTSQIEPFFESDDIIVNHGILKIVYDNLTADFSPEDIFIIGDDTSVLSDIIPFDPTYYGTPQTGYVAVADELQHPLASRTFTQNKDKDEFSLNFWLRVEDENAYDASLTGDTFYPEVLKRLVTFKDDSGEEQFHLDYHGLNLYFSDQNNGNPFPINDDLKDCINDGMNQYGFTKHDAWHFVSMRFDGLNNTLKIEVFDGQDTAAILPVKSTVIQAPDIYDGDIAALLKNGASFYFGPSADDFNTGFFSIASPYVIDRLLTDSEVLRLKRLFDKGTGSDIGFSFNDGSEFNDTDILSLRIAGDPMSTGYSDPAYNAEYTAASGASLRASSEHPNYFKLTGTPGAEYVILRDADSSIYHGLVPAGGDGNFSLIPAAGTETGTYYFGNKNTNYGLILDRWYSITGTVESMGPAPEGKEQRAYLVMRINGDEQRFKLKPGDFHFIYDNADELVPSVVKVYIESNCSLTLSNDMVLGRGNYTLPKTQGLKKTAVSTYFAFDLSGSVDLWYKPFITNTQGFLNYDVVILDSEYITIGAKVAGSTPEAVYYAVIKGSNGSPAYTIETTVKVDQSWQHLQLAYSGINKVIYFYINGSIAKWKENVELPYFGSVAGTAPPGDNVFIGSNMSGTLFAEGYIDDVRISKYYSESLYSDLKPADLNYDPDNLSVAVLPAAGFAAEDMTDISWHITSAEGIDFSTAGSSGTDISQLPAGRYQAAVFMKVNGYRYEDIISFNLDSKPRFTLTDKTPFLFSGEPSDIFFSFRYDHSYRFETDALTYVGVGIRIKKGSTPFKEAFIVQDFLDSDASKWLFAEASGGVPSGWSQLMPQNDGRLRIMFTELVSDQDITCEYKYFYFTNTFNNSAFGGSTEFPDGTENDRLIPLARLLDPDTSTKVITDSNNESKEYEYRVTVGLEGQASHQHDIFKEITIEYDAARLDKNGEPDGYSVTGEVPLELDAETENLKAEIYYDDMFDQAYGTYQTTFRLKYNNINYASKEKLLTWEQLKPSTPDLNLYLAIEEFSLLSLNKESDTADFYLQIGSEGLGEIQATLEVKQDSLSFGNPIVRTIPNTVSFDFFENIPVPERGLFTVKMTLRSDQNLAGYEFVKTSLLTLENKPATDNLKVIFTNTVENVIPYNDVYFSWKGYIQDASGRMTYDPDIRYSYSFDSYRLDEPENAVWTVFNKDWRDVRFYNLQDGYHSFYLRAEKDGNITTPEGSRFFVDIHRPVFHPDLIDTQYNYTPQGILDSVTITGAAGSVEDASLVSLTVDSGQAVTFAADGSFSIPAYPVTNDGVTPIVLTATDKVQNYQEYTVNVEYSVIDTIRFPAPGQLVRYSPLTISGDINPDIREGLTIYVKDPFTPVTEEGNYNEWKKGIINPDRTFFVEDVMVNPGTSYQPVTTALQIACVFDSGKVFTRTLDIAAGEIFLPIEMNLSTHAVEGETIATTVSIDCYANVADPEAGTYISSWSIDFDGDGIYDDITFTDNPELETAKSKSWNHTYSHLGEVHPRVRVITTDGNFFSVSDTLIIHEKTKEVSYKLVDKPISFDTYRLDYQKKDLVFILQGDETDGWLVQVYEISNNQSSITKWADEINLTALGITNPTLIRVMDENNLIIAADNSGATRLYQLTASETSNYSISAQTDLDGIINELALDDTRLYLSYKDKNYFTELEFTGGIMQPAAGPENNHVPVMGDAGPISLESSITKDAKGFLVADFYNQRIIRLSNSYSLLEQFGEYGDGEREFLTPSLVKVHGDRLFVYDETRHDIQVFDMFQPGALDRTYVPVTTLGYNTQSGAYNYLDPEFFNSIIDMDIFTRADGNQLYYYAVILSGSREKLTIIKIPQWQDLRARTRNNKLAYVKEGEIYTAKPDGSDMKKILSSDSLPRINGALDYPALSPDGKSLLFTSRLDLYIGSYYELETGGEPYSYCRVYEYDIEGKILKLVTLDGMDGYEIERPVFSSNGDKMIFSAKPETGKWQLYEYTIGTGTTEQLFVSDENCRYPYYSPDDKFVAFVTDYDGDDDIVIVDRENTSLRINVTNNDSRDSFPVWISIYPDEFSSDEYMVESKIAYVSENKFEKDLYYVYLSRQSEGDIRIVDQFGADTGDDPDSAALLVTAAGEEGDYPCFTGDSKGIIYEHSDGLDAALKFFSFDSNISTSLESFIRASRPAGMKNSITNFSAENYEGDAIRLTWTRYTEKDIEYTIAFKPDNEDDPEVIKTTTNQTGTILTGLKMGGEYRVRVYIEEAGEIEASSQWKTVQIPTVVAKPSFEIDTDNPYLIHLHAWKPPVSQESTQTWYYSWIIENNEILVQKSQDFAYEFATSGKKTILLKAYTYNHENVNISEPFSITIKSDIIPYIDYVLADDSGSVQLSCENSQGNKIDFASAVWTITGPNGPTVQLLGPTGFAQLNGFTNRINVNLTLQRIQVNGQQATDVIVKSKVIDLDFKDVKPVITTAADKEQTRLIHFSGRDSLGNIDWYRANWSLFADNAIIYQTQGVATFDYLFPPRSNKTVYTVSLTLPRKNDGLTETVSQIVSVDPEAIVPKIHHNIITIEKDGEITGQKLVLDATQSIGSSLDYNLTRWSIAQANSYGEQTTQMGPTAIYNLSGITDGAVIQVALTLMRQGGTDAVTVTEDIEISPEETAPEKLVISPILEKTDQGTAVILDVLQSTGPNIDWERTAWLIDGQYSRTGPSVRLDVPAGAEKRIVSYTCTLYRYGSAPVSETSSVDVDSFSIDPLISYSRLSSTQPNVFRLDVLSTKGVNIDWDKTRWYINDGNQDVVIKQGAVITHAFAIQENKMGYPVIAEMFFKGDSKPFVEYISIPVAGNQLLPVIQVQAAQDTLGLMLFSAESSVGDNIDWQQTKWTFIDSAETQYGPVVSHQFPPNSEGKTYTVALTLYRKLNNGEVESKTTRKEIHTTMDQIIPIVRAQVIGDYLVLSAEQSKGQGLLLDRAIWTFPGEGDQVINSSQYQTGTLYTNNFNAGGSVSGVFGYKQTLGWGEDNGVFYQAQIEGHAGDEYNIIHYDGDYKQNTDTFTSDNYHTGPICRRYVGGESKQIVTLFVYRATDQGIEGKSITVNVDLNKARSSAGTSGVSYE